MTNRGRPRKWIDRKDADFGRSVLKCNLVDRIYGDRIIGRRVLRKRAVALTDAFWICDALSPRDAGRALRMPSDDIANLLVKRDVRSHPHKGARLRDFYYTWHKPSKTILRTVGHRIDVLRTQGETLTGAIEVIATEGLHPRRRTNKEFLPPVLIRNYYRRYSNLNL